MVQFVMRIGCKVGWVGALFLQLSIGCVVRAGGEFGTDERGSGVVSM